MGGNDASYGERRWARGSKQPLIGFGEKSVSANPLNRPCVRWPSHVFFATPEERRPLPGEGDGRVVRRASRWRFWGAAAALALPLVVAC